MKKLTSAILTLLGHTDPNASNLDGAAANDPMIADEGSNESERKRKSVVVKDSLADDDAPLPAPAMLDEMYYGLTGEVMREASNGTEVHPAATGIAFICLAGVAFGSGRFVLIGNDKHHPRIYSVHVGRSGIGGKGMALGLVKRIRAASERDADSRFPVCGQFHDGGLSSREGLAWAVRDASDETDKEGNPLDPGVKDKRMFVLEEEMANVLAQSQREGNTLSAGLRSVWDGGDLAPLTKTNRTRATCPHIGIHTCITPSELAQTLANRDLTNGFANRFLYVWGERRGLVPYPRSTPSTTIDSFAKRLKQAISFSQSGGEVNPSQEALDEFTSFYRTNRQGVGVPARVRGLIERHPPYAWRLALIFALLDCSDTITGVHMRAALAWLDFCAESVARIFSSTSQHADAAEAGDLVKRIVETLQSAGGHLDHIGLHNAIGKPASKILKIALAQAEMAGLIEMTILRREGGGRPRRIYTLKPAAAV